MTFEYSDALLLQAVKFSEQVEEGATLTDVVRAVDYINHAIMTYGEFATGTKKLKQIGLLDEQNKRLQTTKLFKDWWTKNHEGKKRIVILKSLEDVKKYLDKSYMTVEGQKNQMTQFTELDFDEATNEYLRFAADIIEKLTTKKKPK